MHGPQGIERRDPAAGLIRLGMLLSALQKQHRSGLLRVEDKQCNLYVFVSDGCIGEVRQNSEIGYDRAGNRPDPERLFTLSRPMAKFEERTFESETGKAAIFAEEVVLRGVSSRHDLFEPRLLSDRIPVETLKLERQTVFRLMRYGLTELEARFVAGLEIPTPVTMALWKRGLAPEHAGALLVALNVLGCFAAWAPGELPRLSTVTRLVKKIRRAATSHQVLGVEEDADMPDIDRAFRRLSFELHPDRLLGLSEQESTAAREMFARVSAAHADLRISRRSARVRSTRVGNAIDPVFVDSSGESWAACLRTAGKLAESGLHKQAAAAALRALSLSPPPHVIVEIKNLLRKCA